MRMVTALIAALAAAGIVTVLGGADWLVALAAALGAVGGHWLAAPAADVVRGPSADAEPPGLREPPLEGVLAAFAQPILLVERSRVTHANAAALAALGSHIVGEDVRLAIRHPAAADRLIGRGDGAEIAGMVELAGVGLGERRWLLSVQPLDEGRRLVLLADRTETHAAERMRVDFVANASHELRTPLATLVGFIETLDDGGSGGAGGVDEGTRVRFLKIMFGEAKRMQRLVDDLISLSRIEADRYSAPQEQVALGSVIAEVRASTMTDQGADAARLVSAIADDVADVTGDRGQLVQLLHNLVGNAIKYGKAGTPVTITLRPATGGVLLSVADEGEGVPPEHLPRLTERFYRVDPGRSRSLGGTGLGLAIVKHIVERHRGRLDIASEVGRGTTVSVLLPAVPRPVPLAAAPAADTMPADTAPDVAVIKV